VTSQQLQGQLQAQNIVDNGNYIKDKHNMKTTGIYNSITFLFICILTQQLKGQLQSEHEWKKETNTHKAQNKEIYNIWVMMMVLK
jgi:hypothetical protein